MAIDLPEIVRRRLEEPNIWHLACLNADGTPQASPMWVDLVDGKILINTARTHVKYRNLTRNPAVALSNNDATENPFDHVQLRGRVVEMIDGPQADEDNDSLARKYIPGATRYPPEWKAPGEERITFLIEPTHVRHYTPG
jgi:PPOX class probable F420-dependent enzyme